MSLSCSLTLSPQRSDRERFVTLVSYELRPDSNPECRGPSATGDYVVPVRREYRFVLEPRREAVHDSASFDLVRVWRCVRVTELQISRIRREGVGG